MSCVQSVTVEVVRAPNPTHLHPFAAAACRAKRMRMRIACTPLQKSAAIPIAIPSRTPGVGSGWSAALAVQFLPAAASPPLFAAHATDASKQASSSSALRSAVEWSEAKLQLACTRGSPPCSGGHLYSESFCPDWTPPTGKAMAMAWSVRQVRITCNNRLSTRYIYLA